jgi:hypothetical protein
VSSSRGNQAAINSGKRQPQLVGKVEVQGVVTGKVITLSEPDYFPRGVQLVARLYRKLI